MEIQKQVLETVQWLVTIFLGLVTASGIGTYYIGSRRIKEAQDAVQELNQLSSELEKKLGTIDKSSKETGQVLAEIGNHLKETKDKLAELRQQCKETENELVELKKQKSDLQQRTIEIQERSGQNQVLYVVSSYSVKLFDRDYQTREVARRVLAELSKDEDPVVRRDCVRVFSTIPDYPEVTVNTEYIIHRLRKLASEETEPVQAVRLDARRALRKFDDDFDAG